MVLLPQQVAKLSRRKAANAVECCSAAIMLAKVGPGHAPMVCKTSAVQKLSAALLLQTGSLSWLVTQDVPHNSDLWQTSIQIWACCVCHRYMASCWQTGRSINCGWQHSKARLLLHLAVGPLQHQHRLLTGWIPSLRPAGRPTWSLLKGWHSR